MDQRDEQSIEPESSSRSARQSRIAKATLVCRRLGAFPVTVQNISAQGIGGRGPEGLQVGEKVVVRFGTLPDLPGVIRWVKQNRFGIAVDTSCSLIELLSIERPAPPINDEVRAFETVRQMHAQTKRPPLMRAVESNSANPYWMR